MEPRLMNPETESVTRDFTVAVFVVHRDRVLLHMHRKLGLWLPPGGHIEPNELPDEAAIREVEEEAGIGIDLIQDPNLPVDRPGQPRQLVRPAGVPLNPPGSDLPDVSEGMVWMSLDDIRSRTDITEEIADWAERAIAAVPSRQ
jgi:8-oxo-dGTP pyrophosphatase MutT (NUDIX family)